MINVAEECNNYTDISVTSGFSKIHRRIVADLIENEYKNFKRKISVILKLAGLVKIRDLIKTKH